MSTRSAYMSHLEIVFAPKRGSAERVTLTPTSIGVDCWGPGTGIVYSQVDFETDLCKGRVFDVFTFDDFHQLRATLRAHRTGKNAGLKLGGLDGYLALQARWDEATRVSMIDIHIPQRGVSHESAIIAGSFETSIELRLRMPADAVKDMLDQLDGLLGHVESLRRPVRK